MSHTSAPIKVVHLLSGDLWAGAEVQAFNLLTSLKRLESIEVSAVLLNEGELASRLRQQNIPVTLFDEKSLNGFQITAALRKYLYAHKPDILHTHRFKENILGALANWLSIRTISLRTTHGAPESRAQGWKDWPKRLLTFFDRWCGNNLQKCVIAVTAELAGRLQAQLGYRKVTVIENGLDFDALLKSTEHSATLQFDTDKTHIAIIGRLMPVKRVDLFLEIAAYLQKNASQHNWQFHIFGDGPLKAQLNDRAHELGVQNVVLFHGQRSDIPACMSRMHAIIMCSDHEGLPMTLLEAMAVGTPVAGHAVGGIAQLLNGNSYGWPAANQRADSYAAALIELLNDPGERRLRTIAARNNVLANFSAQLCAQKHAQLYQELMHA